MYFSRRHCLTIGNTVDTYPKTWAGYVEKSPHRGGLIIFKSNRGHFNHPRQKTLAFHSAVLSEQILTVRYYEKFQMLLGGIAG